MNKDLIEAALNDDIKKIDAELEALGKKALKRVIEARTALVLSKPGIGYLAFQMEPQVSWWHPTMATDGKHCFFNPSFVDTLNDAELRFLLAHETYHNVLGHPWRAKDGNFDHDIANQAMDYAINGELVNDGMKMPKDGLLNAQYTGKAWEVIYGLLCDAQSKQPKQGGGQGEGQPGKNGQNGSGQPQPSGQGKGQTKGGKAASGPPEGPGTQAPGHVGSFSGVAGEVLPAPSETAAEDEATWQAAAKQAAAIMKGRGEGGGLLGKIVAEISKPKVDWRSVLLRFCQQLRGSDYTWRFPSRRHQSRGLYLPSLDVENRVGKLVIGIDISGSTAHAQKQFGAEMQHIVEEIMPETATVIYCDSSVRNVVEFERGDFVTEHVVGNGGTDLRHITEEIERREIEPVALVVLSDLDTPFPEAPGYPVIWISCQPGAQAPFGEVVYMND